MNIPSYTFNIVHIFLIAPLLYYIATRKESVDPWVYTVLLYAVYIMVPYHAYRWYQKTQAK
uniref:Uncharacterized protein n=1 Tax=viral metagenome TaxID=1070528 RepID=A0A6C0H7P4_9ZZZZ